MYIHTSTNNWIRNMCTYFYVLDFPCGSVVKNPPANAGDVGSIPGSRTYPGEGNGNHSGILAWEIPQTEGTGGLESMELQKVGHNLVTKQQHMYTYKICNYIFLIKLKKNSKEIMTFIINRP